MAPAFTSTARLFFASLLVLVAFGGIGVRLYMLHVVEADELSSIIDQNRQQIVVKPTRRGNIVDSKGNVLATTRSEIVLGVDPQSVREEDREKWSELAKLAGVPLSELEKLMEERTRPGKSGFTEDVQLLRWKKISEGLSEARYEEIRALGIRGVYGNRHFNRFYPR